jgi:thymidylate kinase
LQKANNEYLKIGEKLSNERKIFIIDANESIEKTFDKVKNILDKYDF